MLLEETPGVHSDVPPADCWVLCGGVLDDWLGPIQVSRSSGDPRSS